MSKEKHSRQTLHFVIETKNKRVTGQSIAQILTMASDTSERRTEVAKEHFEHRIGAL
jgi:hypothetical protein